VRWRRDFELARPWTLLHFGLLSVIMGLLMTLEEARVVSVLGLLLAAAGVASVVRAVRLFRAGPPDAT
jgi:uncharacterized membrane protein HdeD (DUF308 family)